MNARVLTRSVQHHCAPIARAAKRPEKTLPRSTRAFWLVVLLVVLSAATAVLNWPRHGPGFAVPPAMDAAAITALSDDQLISRVVTDLRFAAAANGDPGRWRALPEPARHVLAIAWVDRDLPPGCPGSLFDGFAALVASTAANTPAFADITAAYEAIGAPATATTVRDAEKIANSLPGAGEQGNRSTDRPFQGADRRFREQAQKDCTLVLLRSYIRTHVNDLAATTGR